MWKQGHALFIDTGPAQMKVMLAPGVEGERTTQRRGLRRSRYTPLERGLAVEVHRLLAMALSHHLKIYSPVKHQLFSLNKSPRGKDGAQHTKQSSPFFQKKKKNQKIKTQMSGFHAQLLSMLKRFFLTAVKVWLRVPFYT